MLFCATTDLVKATLINISMLMRGHVTAYKMPLYPGRTISSLNSTAVNSIFHLASPLLHWGLRSKTLQKDFQFISRTFVGSIKTFQTFICSQSTAPTEAQQPPLCWLGRSLLLTGTQCEYARRTSSLTHWDAPASSSPLSSAIDPIHFLSSDQPAATVCSRSVLLTHISSIRDLIW